MHSTSGLINACCHDWCIKPMMSALLYYVQSKLGAKQSQLINYTMTTCLFINATHRRIFQTLVLPIVSSYLENYIEFLSIKWPKASHCTFYPRFICQGESPDFIGGSRSVCSFLFLNLPQNKRGRARPNNDRDSRYHSRVFPES